MKSPSKTPRQRPPAARQAPQAQAPQTTATPPPSVAELAAALQVTPRRIGQLRKSGLPTASISEALAWRSAQHKTDSSEQLRKERILLVREQREKAKIENEARRGELIECGRVQDSIVQIVSAAKSEFMKLTSDLPPILAGESAPAIQKKLRAAIIAVLTRLSNECDKAYSTNTDI